MTRKGFTLIELLIVVAIIAILAAIAVPNFLEAQTRSKVSRVRSDLRTLATALEAYYIDNNSYPAWATSNKGSNPPVMGVNQFVNQPEVKDDDPVKFLPTFAIQPKPAQLNQPVVATLTTPIAYVTSLFADPFADTKGAIFGYCSGQYAGGQGWFLWSYGPDTDEKEKQGNSMLPCGGDIQVKMVGTGVNAVAYITESFYNPSVTVPGDWLVKYGTYDPSNGTTSNGDVYRYKQ